MVKSRLHRYLNGGRGDTCCRIHRHDVQQSSKDRGCNGERNGSCAARYKDCLCYRFSARHHRRKNGRNEAEGGIRRAIAVVKKRSGNHQNTVREYRLSPHGITIGSPLKGFGGFTLGIPSYTGPSALLAADQSDGS